MFDQEEDTLVCPSCYTSLVEPYILCLQCVEFRVCLQCFSQGYETRTHRNDHNYDVVRNDFSLFGGTWTAKEEMKLLDAIQEYGYGNWSDISQSLQTRTPTECEKHYNKVYVWETSDPLPKFPDPDLHCPPPPVVYKLSDDPPRPADNSTNQLEMSGYVAARSDFMVEFDNYAELDVRDIRFPSTLSEHDRELREAVISVYWRKLAERECRKRIIRDHGLINFKKITGLWNTSSCPVAIPSLAPFARFMSPVQFDMLVEAYTKEAKLKSELRTLQKLRSNGVTRLSMAKLFHKLSARRRMTNERTRSFGDIYKYAQDQKACYNWLQRSVTTTKKSVTRLDITGLPGHDRLTDAEKEFCSTIRFLPSSYLEFKETLINEYRRRGCLRLQQARNVIHIDVNKTRKLYDFMLAQDYVKDKPNGGVKEAST